MRMRIDALVHERLLKSLDEMFSRLDDRLDDGSTPHRPLEGDVPTVRSARVRGRARGFAAA